MVSDVSAAVKPTSVPAVQLRRNKLVLRLWEQCELARAQAAGTVFAPVKFRSVVENDTGIRRQVETPKRVKPWWFVTDAGKLALSVRYGTRVLELAKGKVAVEVGSEKDLVPIPCHRVIKEDGDIGKYRWGEQKKKDMFVWEKIGKI